MTAGARSVVAVLCLLTAGLSANRAWSQEASTPTTEKASFFDRTIARTTEEPWRLRLEPHAWAPNIPIKVTRGDESRKGTITLDDLLDSLNWVVEGAVQVRKGPFGAYIDFVAMDLDFKPDILDGAIETDLDDKVFFLDYGLSFEAGRIAFSDNSDGPGVLIEPYAGLRTLTDSFKLDVSAFGDSLADEEVELTFTTPVAGVRTYWDLTERWKLFGSADIGGFDAFGQDVHRTYQGVGSVGYKFGLFDIPTTFSAGYRAVYIDFRKGGTKLEIWAHGPQLALTLDF